VVADPSTATPIEAWDIRRGWFPLIPVFSERVAEVRVSPKFFEILPNIKN
jgi:hypothetical protein